MSAWDVARIILTVKKWCEGLRRVESSRVEGRDRYISALTLIVGRVMAALY